MNNQKESSYTSKAAIQLELVPEDAQQQDLADVEEEGQSIINYIKKAGYIVTPAYTGRMGGPLYDIMVHTYQIIHDNKELLTAMFASLTTTLTLIDKHKKHVRSEHSPLSSTPMPIEITFQTKDGPLTIKSADSAAALQALEQLRASHLQETKRIDPTSKTKLKVTIPVQKWLR